MPKTSRNQNESETGGERRSLLDKGTMTTEAHCYERAYRTELDPTVEQRVLLARHVGCARVAHNWALERWNAMLASRAVSRAARVLSGTDWAAMEAAGWLCWFLQALDHGATRAVKTPKVAPPRWRYVLAAMDHAPDVAPTGESLHAALVREKNREGSPLAFLREASSFVIREAVDDVADGWKHFFEHLRAGRHERAGHPRFRSATQRHYHADQPNPIRVTERTITIPGIGSVRLKERGYLSVTQPGSHHFVNGGKAIGIGIAEHGGRWYVSLRASLPRPQAQARGPGNAIRARPVPRKKGLVVGVDTGVRWLAVTSLGERFPSLEGDPEILRLIRRMRLWERRKSRRYRAGVERRDQSQGYQEACREVAKYYRKVTEIRDARVRKAVRAIVDTGAERVVVRGQPITDMLRRSAQPADEARTRNALAPRIHGARMGDVSRRLQHKLAWAGGECVVADPAYPSTRRCNVCTAVRDDAPGYPDFHCPSCGHTEDRESNSAKNLRDYRPPPPELERLLAFLVETNHRTPSGDPAGSGQDGRGKAAARRDNRRTNREAGGTDSSVPTGPEAPATGESRSAVGSDPPSTWSHHEVPRELSSGGGMSIESNRDITGAPTGANRNLSQSGRHLRGIRHVPADGSRGAS